MIYGNIYQQLSTMFVLMISGDELGKAIMNYAVDERLNHTTKEGLSTFSQHLSSVQDYREAKVGDVAFMKLVLET